MRAELVLIGVITSFVVMSLTLILFGALAGLLAFLGMFAVLMTCVGAEAAPVRIEAER